MANNTGTFFNINDNDGIPLVGVSTDGKVMINHLYGNCLIGSTSVTGTASQPLQVTGGAYVSGSVGIGTINPTSKLDVVGSIRAVTSTTSATTVRIGNTGNNVFLGVESSTGGTNIIGSTAYAGTLSSNGPLQFSINNGASIQATINASGNVGIGTATPIAKLDVSGDVRVSGVVTASDTTLISLDGTSAVRQRFFPSSGTGNFNWQIAAQTNVNNGFEITPSSASGGSTFSTPAITVKSDGKVGIGVTSPGNLLHLSTAGASYLQIQNTTAANSVYFGNSSGNGIIQVDGANSLSISTNGSERCRVDSSGRLLAGTSSTSADTRAIIQGRSSAGDSTGRLHISSGNDTPGDGDGIAELHFTSSGHVASGRIAAQRDGGTWTAGSSLPTRITFSTTADGASSPTERMRIDNQGRIFTFNSNTGNNSLTVGHAAGAGTAVANFVGSHSATAVDTGTGSFVVWTNGNVENTNNSYGSLSDVKLKENIVDAGSQWNDLKALQVRNYNFKEETGQQTHTQIGLVAQEVELVSPGLVGESPDRDAEGNDLGTVTKSVSYSVLYMKAVKALQEAMERIETLEQRLTAAGID